MDFALGLNRRGGTGGANAAPWPIMKTPLHIPVRFSMGAMACAATLFTVALSAETETHAVDRGEPAPVNRTDTAVRDDMGRREDAGRGTLEHTDRRFVEKAAKSGLEEVAISQVALERTTNPDVKRFAQMIVDEHSRANEHLASIAQTHQVELPAKEVDLEKWRRRDSKDFDRDYIKAMISDHKDAVELFRKEAKDGVSPDVLEFARSTLPKLEEHYERANDLKKMVR